MLLKIIRHIFYVFGEKRSKKLNYKKNKFLDFFLTNKCFKAQNNVTILSVSSRKLLTQIYLKDLIIMLGNLLSVLFKAF